MWECLTPLLTLSFSLSLTHSLILVLDSAAGSRKWIDFNWVILESHISLNLLMWLSRITQLNSSLNWFFDNSTRTEKEAQSMGTTADYKCLNTSTYSYLHCCSFHCLHVSLFRFFKLSLAVVNWQIRILKNNVRHTKIAIAGAEDTVPLCHVWTDPDSLKVLGHEFKRIGWLINGSEPVM